MLRNRLLLFLGFIVLLGVLSGGVIFKLARTQTRARENLERLEAIAHHVTTTQGLAMGGFARAFEIVTSAGPFSGLEAEYVSLHAEVENVFRSWEEVLEELEEHEGGAEGKLRKYYIQVRRAYRRLGGVFYQVIALKQHGQTEEALQILKREHSEVLLQRFAENAEELRFLHEEQGRKLIRGLHRSSVFTYAILGLFVLLVSVVAVLFVRRLLRSLNVMHHGVSLVAVGSLSERLPVDSTDEFGLLAQAFNKMTEDIKETRDELVASKMYMDDIITSMVDSLFVVDRSGKLKTVNQAMVNLLGYTEMELIGQQVGMFLEEPEPGSLSKAGRFKDFMQVDSVRDYGMVYATKLGEKIPMNLWTSSMRDEEGQVVGIVGIARDMREINRLRQKEIAFIAAEVAAGAERKRVDELSRFNEKMHQVNENLREEITERKRAEAQTQASLKEKEVLLKEVHHRVKNNLQLISSLLNLQAEGRGKETQALFEESQHRVRAMAFIHEELYQSKDLARVEFSSYLQTLTAYLIQSYGINPQAITVRTEVEAVTLGVDLAIPYGLMLNELVSNALKHAFPNGRTGEIRITLQKETGKRLVLQVRDNGVGIPPGLDLRHPATLGLQLVTTLTEQVGGTLELTREGGTTFTLTCPLQTNGKERG